MRPVVFLSDYGRDDPFVGLCHAVLQAAAPGVVTVDLTHAVRRQDVGHGARLLADALPWLPAGAVVLAVVDPGVGTRRQAIAVTAGGRDFVGPDNGLLWPVVARAGGAASAVALRVPDDVPRTFHGRDVFAPAAAALAIGRALAELGTRLATRDLCALPEPFLGVAPGRVEAEVVDVDTFGNVALAAGRADLRAAALDSERLVVTVADEGRLLPVVGTFADVALGEPAVFVDAFGRVAVAVNGGAAATLLGVGPGARVVLSH